jgi:hypothetical protein
MPIGKCWASPTPSSDRMASMVALAASAKNENAVCLSVTVSPTLASARVAGVAESVDLSVCGG